MLGEKVQELGEKVPEEMVRVDGDRHQTKHTMSCCQELLRWLQSKLGVQ